MTKTYIIKGREEITEAINHDCAIEAQSGSIASKVLYRPNFVGRRKLRRGYVAPSGMLYPVDILVSLLNDDDFKLTAVYEEGGTYEQILRK